MKTTPSVVRFSQRTQVCYGQHTTYGLTLVELMVVLIVTGILLSIAATPWTVFLQARNLNSAQDQAWQVIRQAQREANHRRMVWQASFREVNGQVQSAVHPSSRFPNEEDWENFPSSIRIDTQETTLRQVRGVYRVQFNHLGRVNSQLGRITFISPRGSRIKRCVIVSTLLGALRKAENQSRPQNGRYCY